VKVVEHNNLIFFEAENLINLMIDNLTVSQMELEFRGDEVDEAMWVDMQENMRGYAAAIKVLIDSYRELTPLADRAEIMLGLSSQITQILEAPRATRL
jgi:hypothetical protein